MSIKRSKGIVMPAKADIQGGHGGIKRVKNWIPACAGMTKGEACRLRVDVFWNPSA
jgi:hypothetical protein